MIYINEGYTNFFPSRAKIKNVFAKYGPKNTNCVVRMQNGTVYGSPERQKSK